jgi:hypothetical protein
MRRFRGVRAHLRALRLPAMRCGLRVSFFDAWAPCLVVELAFAGLDVGADLGDAARARSPVTDGQCAGNRAGGVTWLLTGLLSRRGRRAVRLRRFGGVDGPGGAR